MSTAVAGMTRRLTTPFARGADTLELDLVAAGDAGEAAVAAHRTLVGPPGSQRWSFSEHHALFDTEPDPHYVLTVLRDLESETTVHVDFVQPGGATGSSSPLVLPEATLEGESFVVPLGAHPAPGPQLSAVRMEPDAPDGEAAGWWGLTALLGNLSKLLWVTGWERDRIRRELARVAAQRNRVQASGRSLDLLGFDLGVPRFVPQPYSFDPDTVALLHLDDPVVPGPGQPDAADTAGRYRPLSHHGTNTGGLAEPGAPGRFGTGFRFRAPAAELRIGSHGDFSLGPTRSFTVELFVKPDRDAAGHLATKQATPGSSTVPGWALTLGDFGRGLARNVQWLVSDGTSAARVFTDESLSSDGFHHLAGVIDRIAGEARLYLDGELRGAADMSALGALTNGEPIRLGRHAGAGAAVVADELRLSKVARETFNPAVGEGDESYRRRLGIFEAWTLPTPAGVQDALNDAVDAIAGDSEPLVVDDSPATLVNGVTGVRLEPVLIPPGSRIDQRGNRRVREDEASGAPEDEELRLDPVWLVAEDDPRPVFASPPVRTLEAGEAPPDSRRMHAAASRALRSLLDGIAGTPGQLTVASAFDPRAKDLRAVGRGLLLTHSSLDPPELAAAAHVAGFDFVANRVRNVYVSVRTGDGLTIHPATAPAPGSGADLRVGDTLELSSTPALPAGTQYEWVTIPCGEGRATIESRSDQSLLRLRATAPGRLTVRVEATYRGTSGSGTITLRIGPQDLADGQTIAASGLLGAGPEVADGPEPAPFFHPAYLLHNEEPGVQFPGGLDAQRMQLAVARRLARLQELLTEGGASTGLRVHSGWERAAAGLAGRGRRLEISHTSLGPGALAARAHAAGFSFVKRVAARVELRQREEELLEVEAPPAIDEGDRQPVRLTQRAGPRGLAVGATAVYTANPDTDTVSEIDPASGAVLRAFKVGRAPVAVAVDPAEKRLYSADSLSATVSVVDLGTGDVLAPIKVSKVPVTLVHHRTDDRLFVACEAGQVVQSIDTVAAAVTSQAAIGAGTPRLALARSGSEIWVLSSGAAEVRVFKFEPLTASTDFALSSKPQDIALASNSDEGWATLPDSGRIALLDQGAPGVSSEQALGEHPAHLALSAAEDELYVVDLADSGPVGRVADLAGSEIQHFRLAPTASAVAAASGPRFLCPVPGNNNVAVFERGPAGFGLADNWQLGSGLGEELTWIARSLGAGSAAFGSASRPDSTLVAERAGPVLARVVHSLGDHTPPYTFEVRLKPALEVPATVISKENYDLIMNVLNLLHPIGVEVRTRRIREHVVEVREGLLEAFPDYTYPNFRVPGPRPGGPADEEEE